jgi:hypothetical protein
MSDDEVYTTVGEFPSVLPTLGTVPLPGVLQLDGLESDVVAFAEVVLQSDSDRSPIRKDRDVTRRFVRVFADRLGYPVVPRIVVERGYCRGNER